MKKLFMFVNIIAFAFTVSGSLQAKSGTSSGWPKFKGAWFDVNYPKGFKARPSLRNNAATPPGPGYDSVFFTSPDKSVEFYVYSPHCEGNPTDIALKPGSEEYTARETKQGKNGDAMTYFTIKAKNNSYTRSYVDTVNTFENGCRLVFGIKYTSQKAYAKYKQQYLQFKKSIVRYWHD